MAQFKSGVITSKTTTGNQAYTGIGFQPVLILFFGTQNSADGIADHASSCIGYATSASDRGVVAAKSQNAVSGGTSYSQKRTTSCVSLINTTTNATLVEADLVSMDADGFTLNFTTASGTARRIGYLAFSAQALTNVKGGEIQSLKAL